MVKTTNQTRCWWEKRPGSQANSGDLCVEDLQTLDEEETAAVAVPRFWLRNQNTLAFSIPSVGGTSYSDLVNWVSSLPSDT